MSTALPQLLAQRAQLEAQAEPLRERLARCDAAILAADKTLAVRDRLLQRHDRTVADCIANGRYAPPADPELDESEIQLRRAKSQERGALLARARVQEQLASLNGQLTELAAQIDEEIWLSVPAGASHLFAAAEAAMIEYEERLSALDGIARYAFEQAHQRAQNGAPPEATAAWRCYIRMGGLVTTLMERLGSSARRDFRSGPELLKSITEGKAELGDIARFEPPSMGAQDGSGNINRGEPLGRIGCRRPRGTHPGGRLLAARAFAAGRAGGFFLVSGRFFLVAAGWAPPGCSRRRPGGCSSP
jgi:hypothetical protein